MRHQLLLFAVLSLSLPLTVEAQQQHSVSVCVKHLTIPTAYPALARQARIQGIVVAKIKVATDGTVAEVLVEAQDPLLIAHPILQKETQQLVRQWTFECQTCAPGVGFEHVITFNYRLEGEDSRFSDTRVSMELPDAVSIIARPPVIEGDTSQTNPKW